MAHGAIVGKLNSKALSKAVTKATEVAQPTGQTTPFQEILNRVESGAEFADMLGVGKSQNPNPTAQMQALEADAVAFTPEEGVTEISSPEASEKVLDLLGEVNKGQMQMNSLVNHVLYGGKKFSNQELLVIQAHVFHFAQMTELTVKVAEQGVSSMKAVMNTQVQ